MDTSRVSARRPKYFLCFAKERIQRKATADSLPSGVPIYAVQKMGNARNSPAAQTSVISDPFSALHKWLRPKRVKVKNNPNVKNNSNPKTAVDRRQSTIHKYWLH
ncbi:hypothetical protein [Undibacterium umbellatum]|uniref:Uncharacterized protein n=1 Tax=Undibacterium umbellatum TaxID=2762300 RepID=A0ABR6Z768_9BURK|nr:hypothetical protein [Undibacterium umbellatum]MBC3907171.1 hypothetical protein [Undibacterium umbellatum]